MTTERIGPAAAEALAALDQQSKAALIETVTGALPALMAFLAWRAVRRQRRHLLAVAALPPAPEPVPAEELAGDEEPAEQLEQLEER